MIFEFYLSVIAFAAAPLQHANRYIRDIPSHRRLTREAPNNSSVLSSSTLPTPMSNHLQHINSSKQSGINTSKSTSAAVDSNGSHRIKRQSAGREQLCQTTYQYITPQAALNSQGNAFFFYQFKEENV